MTWDEAGPLIEKYVIGSEGGSAWAWLGDDPKDMTLVGATGYTQLDAIDKVVTIIEERT